MASINSSLGGSVRDTSSQPLIVRLSPNFAIMSRWYESDRFPETRSKIADTFFKIQIGDPKVLNDPEDPVLLTLGDFVKVPRASNILPIKDTYYKFFDIDQNIDKAESDSKMFQECFLSAKDFLQDFLRISIPNFFIEQKISSIDDITVWLDKKFPYPKDALLRSAIIFLTRAFWEVNRKELNDLHSDTNVVIDTLFSLKDGDDSYLTSELKEGVSKLKSEGCFDPVSVNFVEKDYSLRIPVMNARGKNPKSLVAKMAKEYELNAEKIARDGVGLRMEIPFMDDESLGKFLLKFSNFISHKLNVTNLKIQNTNMFTKDEMESLNNSVFVDSPFRVELNKHNAATDPNFKNVKIRSNVVIPGTSKEHYFEIQICFAGNENERGLASKYVYKAKQILSIFSRLIGPFTDDYFDMIVETASRACNMDFNLVKKKLMEDLLICSYKKKRWYYEKGHFNRKKDAGVLDSELMDMFRDAQ